MDIKEAPYLPSVCAIVVLHNSFLTVVETISSLVEAGVGSDKIVIVDNSTELWPDELSNLIPKDVGLLKIQNFGYGNAVNQGIKWLNTSIKNSELTLVCSHESIIDPASLKSMVDSMMASRRLGAVGPLLSLAGTDQIWSTGGRLSGLWLRPVHDRSLDYDSLIQFREWLDGSIVLYRTSLLNELQFDEQFFLYVEEVDLHYRIRQSGFQIGTIASAHAWQNTRGMPPFFRARNLYIFTRKHVGRFLAGALATRELLLSTLRFLSGRGAWKDTKQMLAGLKTVGTFQRDPRIHHNMGKEMQ